MQRGRARRRITGLVAASILHAIVLGALAIGAHGPPPPAEPQIVQVLLTPPRRSRPPPKPVETPRPIVGRRTIDPAPIAPVVLQAPTVDPRQALMAAPFEDGARAFEALRRRKRCQDLVRVDDLEREHCPTGPRPDPLGLDQVRTKDADGAFAQAARRKEAIRTYKNTTSDDTFPGLRCSFGHAC